MVCRVAPCMVWRHLKRVQGWNELVDEIVMLPFYVMLSEIFILSESRLTCHDSGRCTQNWQKSTSTAKWWGWQRRKIYKKLLNRALRHTVQSCLVWRNRSGERERNLKRNFSISGARPRTQRKHHDYVWKRSVFLKFRRKNSFLFSDTMCVCLRCAYSRRRDGRLVRLCAVKSVRLSSWLFNFLFCASK